MFNNFIVNNSIFMSRLYKWVLHSRSILGQFYETILCILHVSYIPKDNTGTSYSYIALLWIDQQCYTGFRCIRIALQFYTGFICIRIALQCHTGFKSIRIALVVLTLFLRAPLLRSGGLLNIAVDWYVSEMNAHF